MCFLLTNENVEQTDAQHSYSIYEKVLRLLKNLEFSQYQHTNNVFIVCCNIFFNIILFLR